MSVGEDLLQLLLFADDIVLFADSAEELQRMLEMLEEYCKQWRFEINVGKSKVMVVGGGEEEGEWRYGGKEMGRVSEYKYVGVMVSEDGGWKKAAQRVVEKAGAASKAMRWWLGRHWGVSPRAKVDVWSAVVGAQLRYGSEVWWPGVYEEREMEKVQLGYLKDVMRLNRSTTNEFVRGEIGMYEVKRDRVKAMLVWMGRLECMGRERWARRLFEAEWVQGRGKQGVKRMTTWKKRVQGLVGAYGLGEALRWLRVEKDLPGWQKEVQEAVDRVAEEDWWTGVRAGKKLGPYLRVKEEWGMEAYLEGVLGRGDVLLARFRSGSAAVGQETARWAGGRTGVWAEDGTERKRDKSCVSCETGVVETAEHVLMECEAFREEREQWWEEVRGVLGEGWSGAEGFSSFDLVLGRRVPGLSEEGRLTCWVASAGLCARVWSARSDLKYGQRSSRLESKTFGLRQPT